MPLSSAIAHYQ